MRASWRRRRKKRKKEKKTSRARRVRWENASRVKKHRTIRGLRSTRSAARMLAIFLTRGASSRRTFFVSRRKNSIAHNIYSTVILESYTCLGETSKYVDVFSICLKRLKSATDISFENSGYTYRTKT